MITLILIGVLLILFGAIVLIWGDKKINVGESKITSFFSTSPTINKIRKWSIGLAAIYAGFMVLEKSGIFG